MDDVVRVSFLPFDVDADFRFFRLCVTELVSETKFLAITLKKIHIFVSKTFRMGDRSSIGISISLQSCHEN